MDRLTNSIDYCQMHCNLVKKCLFQDKSKCYDNNIYNRLREYEDAEEQGKILRLDSKDELIEVLASKLLNEQFGVCYMCKNSMKNITLDGVNNGCDGGCNLSEEHTVDDFLKKIVGELERKKQSRH